MCLQWDTHSSQFRGTLFTVEYKIQVPDTIVSIANAVRVPWKLRLSQQLVKLPGPGLLHSQMPATVVLDTSCGLRTNFNYTYQLHT